MNYKYKNRKYKRNPLNKFIIYLFIVFFLTVVLVLIYNFSNKQNNTKKLDLSETEISSIYETEFDTELEYSSEFYTTTEQQTEITTEFYKNDIDENVIKILSNMTIEQKVLQMFIVTPEALTGYSRVTSAGEATKKALNTYPVGGIIYFKDNILNENQLLNMVSNTKKFAEDDNMPPLFICVDEEGGSVTRIAGNPAFNVPSFSDMTYIKTQEEAFNVGNSIGKYLNKYGFNVDFAPVADVITDSRNKVIGNRSFGTDPDFVSQMALKVRYGIEENNVFSVYKHFPGHGGTIGDTHDGFSYTEKTYDELMNSELIPFKDGIENGIDFIMVSHISAPNITGSNVPSSLSNKIITDILRKDLNYNGIIITDAMNMGAISNNYSNDIAVKMAINAGNDIILMPKNFISAYSSIVSSVRSGEISEERIDESVKRILKAKFKRL